MKRPLPGDGYSSQCDPKPSMDFPKSGHLTLAFSRARSARAIGCNALLGEAIRYQARTSSEPPNTEGNDL